LPRYNICQEQPVASPAVYLVHHQNLRGPFLSMLWFDKPLRPWALGVFFDRRTCFRQYFDYTLTKRFGLAKIFAVLPAYLLSVWVTGIMPIIRAIPVYRGKQAIVKTFRQSLAALGHGDDLLIIPDVDYANKGVAMGEMHRGFLLLDKFFARETNRHLSFVPLFVRKAPRCILVGDPVSFTGRLPFKEEQAAVYDSLVLEFRRLENLEPIPVT
jgi:hypothetical protein